MEDEELQLLLYHLSLMLMNFASFLLNLAIVLMFIRYRKRLFRQQKVSRRSRATNHNKFLLSMVMADLFVGFFGALTGVMLKFVGNPSICTLWSQIPLYGSLFVSVCSLVFLTLDRLYSIKYPFSYDSLMRSSRVTKLIVFSWIIPLVTTVFMMVIYVTSGPTLELKIRNALVSMVSLTALCVLAMVNYTLIQKVKEQRSRAATSADSEIQLKEVNGEKSAFGETGIRKRSASDPGISKRFKSHPTVEISPASETSFGSVIVEDCTEIVYKCQINNTVAIAGHCSSKVINLQTDMLRKHTLSLQFDKTMQDKDSSSLKIPGIDIKAIGTLTRSVSLRSAASNASNDLTIDIDSEYSFEEGAETTSQPVSRTTKKTKRDLKLLRKLRERKITIMCICNIVAFLICWLPLVGYRFSYVVGRTTEVYWLLRLTQCLVLSNSLLNPFIYFMVRKDFRKLLKKLLRIK